MSEKKVQLQYMKYEDKSDLQLITMEIIRFRIMSMTWKTPNQGITTSPLRQLLKFHLYPERCYLQLYRNKQH